MSEHLPELLRWHPGPIPDPATLIKFLGVDPAASKGVATAYVDMYKEHLSSQMKFMDALSQALAQRK